MRGIKSQNDLKTNNQKKKKDSLTCQNINRSNVNFCEKYEWVIFLKGFDAYNPKTMSVF